MTLDMKLSPSLSNTKEFWALLEKSLKAISSFFVIFIVAKNVDSNDFGYYALIEVLLSVGLIISIAGTDIIANKVMCDLGKLKATRVIIKYRFFFSLMASLFLLMFVIFSNSFSISPPIFIAVLFFFLSPLCIVEQLYYHEGKYIDVYKVKISFIFVSIFLKSFAIFSDFFLELMVLSFFCEALAPVYIYLRRGSWFSFRETNSISDYKVQLYNCIPVLLSSLSIVIYSKIDQFMIASILNNSELAKYNIVVRISDSFIFLPALVGALYLPKAYKDGFRGIFIENYFRLIFILSFFALFSSLIIYAIFVSYVGEAMSISWESYIIYQFTIIFSFTGVAMSQFQIYAGNAVARMVRILVGLVINLLLNFFLIPIYGISGAIYSTLFSLFVSNFFLLLFTRERHILSNFIYSMMTFYKFKFSEVR